jgi:signal transduction histidine kinase
MGRLPAAVPAAAVATVVPVVLAAVAVAAAAVVVFVAGQHDSRGVFGLLTVLAYAATAWIAYLTGLTLPSRRDTAVVAGTAVAAAALQIAHTPGHASQHVSGLVAFVVLPLLVGRYLAQHRTLVRTLDANNRQLRTERALLAEREQLRERLRIARDVHDSLGRRLSLVSVQAAALEVGDLPPAARDAVRALAGNARTAVTELYEVVGSLRATAEEGPGVERLPALADEFRAAGVGVTVGGECGPLPPAASRAAYRVVAEGLANAAKHAPGRPVAIRLTREADSVVVTVTNPLPDTPAAGAPGGYGLAGLAERVGAAGGFLDHRTGEGEFRLVAMLPTADPEPVAVSRVTVLGVVTGALLFVLLPVSLLTGVG